MTSNRTFQIFLGLYISIFFLYLFGPLIIMSVTAFNSAEFPSITPWECFSFRWFNEGKIAFTLILGDNAFAAIRVSVQRPDFERV